MGEKFYDPDAPVATSCPHCGHESSVQSTDSLSPQVCSKCQQIHVATLNVQDAPDSDAGNESVTIPKEFATTAQRRAFLGKIGRYRVSKILGAGAFGVVYQAWDPRLHRWVAIKVPKLAQRRQVVEDFLREARTAARLRHPRIVSVYDAETANGRPFIIVEFVEGETLAEQLRRGSIAPRRAARIVYELAQAVQHAHREGIVHRDIKPANIMIDDRGMPRLMDFGLAQLSVNQAAFSGGTIAGTPAYMAPEVARRDAQSGGPASDQYSLGIVFFECLVGRRPFEPFRGNVAELLQVVANEAPPRVRESNTEIPEELDEICARMTSLAADERYPDLGFVARQLAQYLKSNTDASLPTVSTPEPSRRPSAVQAGLAVVSAILVTLLIVLLLRSEPEEAKRDPAVAATEFVSPAPVVPTVPEPAESKKVDSAPEMIEPPKPEIARPEPSTVETVAVVPEEPPADALSVISNSKAAVVELESFDPRPTYPALVLNAESDRETFLNDFRMLLSTGFPKKRLDDKGFEKVLSIAAKLKKLAPHEPRVPYALAIISKRYLPLRAADKQKVPKFLDLLKEARTIGGYPFTPAFLSEVDYWISNSNFNGESIRDGLSEIAVAITTPADWPDMAERKRVATWLGTAYGYFGSGVSGKIKDDLVIRKTQEKVEERLPKDLRDVFLKSILATQEQFAAVDSTVEKKVNAAKIDTEEQIKQKLADIEQAKESTAEKLENQKRDDQKFEEEFKGKAAVIENAFEELGKTLSPLIASRQLIVQQMAIQQNILNRAMLAKMQSDPASAATGGAGGTSPSGADMMGGGAATATARLQLQQLNLELLAVNAQIDQCCAQGAILQDKAIKLTREYSQKKGKNIESLNKLTQNLASLNQKAKAATATKALKLPDDVLKNRRLIREIHNWFEWSESDAKDWLEASIQQFEPGK